MPKMTGKSNPFLGNKLLLALLALILLLIPNTPILVKGLAGFFITYLVWGMILALAIPLLDSRGRGLIGAYEGAYVGLAVVAFMSLLGFFFGFTARKTLLDPGFLASKILIVIVESATIEAGRAAVMGLFGNHRAKLLLGVLAGLIYGSTLPSISSELRATISGDVSALSIISLMPAVTYSLVATWLQLDGGIRASLPFRLVIDLYWRASPLILSTSNLGILWIVVSTLSIYGSYAFLVPESYRLPGGFRETLRRYMSRARLASMAGNVVVTALIVVLGYMLYSSIVPLVIISGSMEPTLSVGDVILVSMKDAEKVSEGDVIVFWHEGMLVAHRVVEKVPGGYKTKGDALEEPDPFIVPSETVVGRVVGSIPGLGWIAIYARRVLEPSNPLGLAGIDVVGVAAIASVAGSLLYIRSRRAKNRGMRV